MLANVIDDYRRKASWFLLAPFLTPPVALLSPVCTADFQKVPSALRTPDSTPWRHAMQTAQALVNIRAKNGLLLGEQASPGAESDDNLCSLHIATELTLGVSKRLGLSGSRICRRGSELRQTGWLTEASQEANLCLDDRVLTTPSAGCCVETHSLTPYLTQAMCSGHPLKRFLIDLRRML